MLTALLALGAFALVAVSLAPRAWADLAARARLALRAGTLRRERRVALPGLVEALASALASGLSLPQAFAEIAPAMPRSLSAPTQRVAACLALGTPIDRALAEYRAVVPSEDVAPLAVVLGAFVRAGGRVSRSLGRVAALLRGRLALADEQAALTAQGRASATVLVLLAPLGAAFLATAMPDYLPTLIGRGLPLLVVAITLEVIAALWLRRLLRLAPGGAELASLLDAVIVGLDAGMTFEQALRALVERAPTLGHSDAARHLLADLALGQGTRRAFAAFSAAGPTEARVAALIASSTRFGAPLADLLVTQADALRDTDRRRAEAAARRLPILMLFPLSFCVLPALLIVFLGPPLLSLVQ